MAENNITAPTTPSNTQHQQPHYMPVKWHETVKEGSTRASDATLEERSDIVGRVGTMMLSVGTGAWRVIDSMDTIARTLSMDCVADVGLTSISFTCMSGTQSHTAAFSIPATGVNTEKLRRLEHFVDDFAVHGQDMTLQEIHSSLDSIQHTKAGYTPLEAGLSSGAACAGFTFLLGAGPIEMAIAFIGAFVGNWFRRHLIDWKLSLIPNVTASVAAACVVSILCYMAAEQFLGIAASHEAGYLCAMLFVIPGFPLITGGIDLVKSNMRSGLERLAYALLIITVATFTGWIVAQFLNFHPADFVGVDLDPMARIVLRLICSFVGVFGFSQMFNSTPRMAATSGVVGMIANTLRLELVDLAGAAPAVAAFIGALCAGLLASRVHRRMHYPRIVVSVPSIVIMVPGLYMYRAVYDLAIGSNAVGATWLFNALFIVLALPLGLIIARTLTDKRFRVCD